MISFEQYLQFSPYFAQEDIEKEEDILKFFESFDRSSPKIKNFLTSMDTAEKIINTCKSFQLDDYDTEAVSLAVREVAMGKIPISELGDFIVNETELPPEKATDLANLIINQVLAPTTNGFAENSKASTQKTPEKPDLKIDPGVNRNNVVDLRNRQN